MTEPDRSAPPLPEVVLIGKAGAGKSTLFAALSGQRGRVGDGLATRTQGEASIDLPADAPVMRLTDTDALRRGGNPPADAPGRVWLAVARLDDPVQAPLADALAALRRARRGARVALALTGADRLADPAARGRAAAAIKAELARAAGGPLPWVTLGQTPDGTVDGLDTLVQMLAQVLPAAAALAEDAGEPATFQRHRPLILRYATSAGAADLVPVVGVLGVTAAQGAMLAALARALGMDWTPTRAAAFAAALGGAAILRQGVGLVIRQGAKLVPVVGQTLGAAAAAATSTAATFALGRAAHAWLWAESRGQPIPASDLRALYTRALAQGLRDDAR